MGGLIFFKGEKIYVCLSLVEQVFEHLETDILSGKYSRGEILAEGKLSLKLGGGRTAGYMGR